MAELEMLPAWAGRLAEPSHPPQPPTPPRRYATDPPSDASPAEGAATGATPGENGNAPLSANGHGAAVLVGQPPLPSGEHRLEPDSWAPPEADTDDDVDADDHRERASATMTTSELPVVAIPFDDETTSAPDQPAPHGDDSLIDTVETPVDNLMAEASLDEVVIDAEIVEEPDEIVDEPDEIELLEDTDPVGSAADDNSPVVAPVAPADADHGRPQGRRVQEPERDRPALRVLSLLALALLVVAAGVAAGYLFVALTGS